MGRAWCLPYPEVLILLIRHRGQVSNSGMGYERIKEHYGYYFDGYC